MSPSTPTPDEFPRPPWAAEPRRPRRNRRNLSSEQIVDVALAIIPTEGTEAVTMRRVASELGVAVSSLYAHVDSREQLLDRALDVALRDLPPLPETDDWVADFRQYFINYQRLLSRYADLGMIRLATVPSSLEAFRSIEELLARLIEADVPAQIAAWGLDRLHLYTAVDVYEGWLFQKRMLRNTPDAVQWANPGEFSDQFRTYILSLPEEQFPTLRRSVDAVLAGDSDQRYIVGIDMLLAGIKAAAPTS